MSTLTPYLFFNGNCKEAMEFYQRCLGGELNIMTYGDQDKSCPIAQRDQVMHALLARGDLRLMASDSPGHPVQSGSSVHIAMNCDSLDEIERTFAALAEGGRVTSPLRDEFWGDRFGTLTDRYGMQWMLTCRVKGK